MSKAKNAKQALLTSVLALVLCMSMLIGTTFAWFTDSVTSTGNKIQAGTLNIDLLLLEENNFVSIKEKHEPIFNYNLWEPGYTEAKILKVVNNGTLALKWKARFVAESELSKLAEVIDVYVLPGATAMPTDRILAGYTRVGTLAEFVNTIEDTTYGVLGTKEDDSVATLGIALKMQESAGNEYQNLDLGGAFDIQILATQYTYEEDSFDNQYDKDAAYDLLTNEELADAIANGGTFNLGENLELNENNSTVNEGVNLNLGLNGNVVGGAPIMNEGELTISDGTIGSDESPVDYFQSNGDATLTNIVMNTGTAADYSNIISGAEAEVTYNNVDVNANGGGIGATAGAEVVFNSGSVKIISATTNPRYNFYIVGAGTKVVINDGEFDFTSKTLKRAYIYAAEGTTVEINGGTFGTASTRSGYTDGILGTGTVIIKGGTFGFNPSKWVADGYEAVQNGSTWTVSAK